MVKISINSKKLMAAVQSVGSLIRPTTVTVLENILFELSDGKIKLTADNTEIRSTVELICECKEELSVCIPYDLFTKILKGFPDTAINLTFNELTLNISHNSASHNLTMVSAAEYPNTKETDSENQVLISALELSESLKKSNIFVDTTRQDSLAYTLIKTTAEKTVVVGFSGWGGVECSIEAPGSESLLLLSSASSKYLQNALFSDEEVKLNWDKKQLRVTGADIDVSITLMEGIYPDYEKNYLKQYDKKYNINTSEILPVVKRIAGIADKDHARVHLQFSNKELKIIHKNIDYGHDSKEQVPVEFEGDPINIDFSIFYLSNLLSSLSEDAVMYLSDSKTHVIVKTETSRSILSPMWDK